LLNELVIVDVCWQLRELWGKVQRLVYVSKRGGSKLVPGQVVVPKLGLGLGQGSSYDWS